MDVAAAMMTTDTRPKTVLLGGVSSKGPFKMLGMAKGAGMIAPNMATLLAVILTDIKSRTELAQGVPCRGQQPHVQLHNH